MWLFYLNLNVLLGTVIIIHLKKKQNKKNKIKHTITYYGYYHEIGKY